MVNIYFYSLTQTSYLLKGDEDAKPVGTGKLIHMAGAVGAVLELISCVGAVFLPITHKA